MSYKYKVLVYGEDYPREEKNRKNFKSSEKAGDFIKSILNRAVHSITNSNYNGKLVIDSIYGIDEYYNVIALGEIDTEFSICEIAVYYTNETITETSAHAEILGHPRPIENDCWNSNEKIFKIKGNLSD